MLLHELGHWKFSHTLANLVITSAHLFLILWLYGVVMHSLTSAMILSNFGYGGTASVIVSLTTFMMLLTPLEQVVMQLMAQKSRRNEFQADSFAMSKGVVNEGLIIIDEGEALVDNLVFEEGQEVGLRSVGMIREVLRGGRIGRKREAEIGVPIRR